MKANAHCNPIAANVRIGEWRSEPYLDCLNSRSHSRTKAAKSANNWYAPRGGNKGVRYKAGKRSEVIRYRQAVRGNQGCRQPAKHSHVRGPLEGIRRKGTALAKQAARHVMGSLPPSACVEESRALLALLGTRTARLTQRFVSCQPQCQGTCWNWTETRGRIGLASALRNNWSCCNNAMVGCIKAPWESRMV